MGLVVAGCAAPVREPPPPTTAEWTAAVDRLEALRHEEPEHPYGIVVRVTLREPRTRKAFSARGALAVDPHRAVRMLLLGPGGTTALDAWVTPDSYRFEVPPIGLLRRGGTDADPSLPVEFFRWWFLAPVEGRLLASFAGPSLALSDFAACDGHWFVLRRDRATVTLCDDREGPGSSGQASLDLRASERTPISPGPGGSRLERLSFRGLSLAPHAGDLAEYEDARSGVRAHVEVESRDTEAPDPVAFLDPDHGGAR
jgi:hypothetical protein